MSFNLRYASPVPPNDWPARLPVAQAAIAQQAPDVMGTQEGLYEQLKQLEAALSSYRWIGLGREGGSHGEFMAVFYRSDRLEPLEYDHFWLSDTPLVMGSATWGNSNRRMVTWVRFRDHLTQKTFYFINTHLDFTDAFHVKAVTLLKKQLQALNPEIPQILVGDFNAAGGESVAWKCLVETGDASAFTDTWCVAPQRRQPELATFHGYENPAPCGNRIDWILTCGPVDTLATETVTYLSPTGQYPSDHFPICADLVLQ